MALSTRDRNLLDRCLAHEAEAWESFVERFAGLVIHVVEHSARSRAIDLTRQDRDDFVAEVFSALVDQDFRVLRRFRGRSSLATYLTVVARRVCVRGLLRQRGRERTSLVNQEVPGEDDFRQHFEDADLVRHLLEQLTDHEARLVQAFYLNHETYRDMALRLDIPENSIGPTLSRARRKMHRWLRRGPTTRRSTSTG